MAHTAKLIRALAENGAGAGLVVGVNVADYNAIMIPHLEKPIQPYTFVLLDVMKRVAVWASQLGYRDPISYFTDTPTKGSHRGMSREEILTLKAEVEESLEITAALRFARHSWSSIAKDPQLHAADILAYESYKEAVNGIVEGEKRRPRELLRALFPTVAHHTFYDKRLLPTLAAAWLADEL